MTEADINAEANRILALLRACTTEAEVHEVADAERGNVRALKNAGATARVQHIVNLKAHLIGGFGE